MSYKTINALMLEVEEKLSQTPGTSVQLYSADRIAQSIVDAYSIVSKELWWPDLMVWEQRTLDENTGIVTSDFTNITRYEDIRAVFWNGTDARLPELARDINPYRLTGNNAQFVEPITAAGRLFRILPVTSVGSVEVHGRTYPTEFLPDTELRIDPLLLVYWAAWDYCVDDGANPGQETKFQRLFDMRLNQLKAEYSRGELALNSHASKGIPTEWH